MSSPSWFVIVSQGRSGSTLLCHSLAMRPGVHMYHEILHPHYRGVLPVVDGFRRISAAFHEAPKDSEAVGMKLHVTHPSLHYPHWESAWKFVETSGIKVVVLSRANPIEQLASYRIASQTGLWSNQSEVRDRPTFRIDPEELKWFVRFQRSMLQARIANIPSHLMYSVHYEDMIENWQLRIVEILSFIGFENPRPLPMAIQKQENRPIQDVVLNYQELESALNEVA